MGPDLRNILVRDKLTYTLQIYATNLLHIADIRLLHVNKMHSICVLYIVPGISFQI